MHAECGAGDSGLDLDADVVRASVARVGRATVELDASRVGYGLHVLTRGEIRSSADDFSVAPDAVEDLSDLGEGSLDALIGALRPDQRPRPWIQERNVAPRLPHLDGLECYDLALRQTVDRTSGVLEVTARLRFDFVNPRELDWSGYRARLRRNEEILGGAHALEHMLATRFYPGQWAVDMNTLNAPRDEFVEWVESDEGQERSRGGLRTWNRAGKRAFQEAYERRIERAWSGNHRITELSGSRLYRSFRVRTIVETGRLPSVRGYHWRVKAINLAGNPSHDDARARSLVNYRSRINYADSRDVLNRAGTSRSTCVHEFGHMLGLRDEYFAASPYYGDKDGSVMGAGAEVRARHYAPFADWIERKVREVLGPEHPELRGLTYGVRSPHGVARVDTERLSEWDT